VEVSVAETGDDVPPAEINVRGVGTGECPQAFIATNANDAPVLNNERSGVRSGGVKGRKAPVSENRVSE